MVRLESKVGRVDGKVLGADEKAILTGSKVKGVDKKALGADEK